MTDPETRPPITHLNLLQELQCNDSSFMHCCKSRRLGIPSLFLLRFLPANSEAVFVKSRGERKLTVKERLTRRGGREQGKMDKENEEMIEEEDEGNYSMMTRTIRRKNNERNSGNVKNVWTVGEAL